MLPQWGSHVAELTSDDQHTKVKIYKYEYLGAVSFWKFIFLRKTVHGIGSVVILRQLLILRRLSYDDMDQWPDLSFSSLSQTTPEQSWKNARWWHQWPPRPASINPRRGRGVFGHLPSGFSQISKKTATFRAAYYCACFKNFEKTEYMS